MFEASFQSASKPNITWFHGERRLSTAGRYKVAMSKPNDSKEYSIALTVNDVVIEDAGKYRAIVRNSHGESAASITLNFDSK